MDMDLRLRLPFILAGLLILLPLLGGAGFVNPAQTTRSSGTPLPSPVERIDINSATLEQLMGVPGMTGTWAARIIRFRPYRAKNDLIDRGVVTSEVYNRIKDHIVAHRAKS